MTNRELVLDIAAKLEGKSPLEWSEIRDKYMPSVSADYVRKAGVGIKMAIDAGMLNKEGGKDLPQTINDPTKMDVFALRQQFYDQRKEYDKLLRDSARWDYICEELIKCAGKLNSEKMLPVKAPERVTEEYEAVAVLSDWHYGMKASNLWNEYNTDIATERVQKYLQGCEKKLKLYSPKKLYVVILGDMINGSIHTTSRLESSENTVDQIMHVSELIAESVSCLSQFADVVEVKCTYGNHARTIQNKDDSIQDDNLERIIPFWLNQRFAGDSRIFIQQECKDVIFLNPFGHGLYFVHGDNDRMNPYDTLKLAYMCEKEYSSKPEYVISGHMHHVNEKEELGILHVGVGSLCGSDEYAKSHRKFSTPSQTLLMFNKDGLDGTYTFRL